MWEMVKVSEYILVLLYIHGALKNTMVLLKSKHGVYGI